MIEEWKEVKGYDAYLISNAGRVLSKEREVKNRYSHRVVKERIKQIGRDKDGYPTVGLSKKGKTRNLKIHRLVAKAFIPNPNNFKEINHIDGDKTNNCVNNLEWCTRSHNLKHAFKLGLLTVPNRRK